MQAAEQVLTADSHIYIDTVKALHKEHVSIGRETINDKQILEQYLENIGRECDHLLRILESARTLKAVTDQTEDMVVSVGEKLSCLLMVALLQARGTQAVCIDLGEIVSFSSTAISLNPQFYRDLACAIRVKVLALDSKAIPVLTGFFGKVPGGLLKQVGRGYTDLCAAIVAVGLQAIELQIWKEFDGIFTADPQKVSQARLLDTVTPAEAAELSFCSSGVIHPFTMDHLILASIPVRIKSVRSPSIKGTAICPDLADICSGNNSSSLFRNRSTSSFLCSLPNQPTAVTTKSQITVLNVRSKKRTRAHGFLASIFSILDQNGLSVDLIASSEVHISMAIHSEKASLATVHDRYGVQIQDEALKHTTASLKALGEVSIVPNQAIIFLIGRQLRGTKGISGRFLSTLGEYNINIEMISQGASEISIGCVVHERDALRGLNAIHHRFFEYPSIRHPVPKST